MRQILFRGKRLDNAEWVEGNLNTTYYGGAYISTFDKTYMAAFDSVDPTTVGQYTGLKDKNGKRIFEGDCAKIDGGEDGIMYGDVCFRQGGFFFEPHVPLEVIDTERCFEVIGNIHDKEPE